MSNQNNMAFPWGAVIGGGANLGSSFISNSGSRKSQKRALRYNLDFWRQQNEYNHPSAQMSRLREAGLNPNLIYGTSPTSATGNAEKIAPAQAADFNFESPIRNLTEFADVRQKSAQTNNLRAQGTVLEQEAILKGAQTADMAQKTAKSKFDLGLAKELKDTSLQAAQMNLRKMESETIQSELDQQFKSETIKDRVKDVYYRVKNAHQTLEGSKLLNQLRQLEVDLKKIGIERNDPWYFRIFGRALGKDGVDQIFNKR